MANLISSVTCMAIFLSLSLSLTQSCSSGSKVRESQYS